MPKVLMEISRSVDGFVAGKFLNAGLLDEVRLHVVPVVLGAGTWEPR